jgi:hypothetical protein
MNQQVTTLPIAGVLGIENWIENQVKIDTHRVFEAWAVSAEWAARLRKINSDYSRRAVSPTSLPDPAEAAESQSERFIRIVKTRQPRFVLLKKLEGIVVLRGDDFFVAHFVENYSDVKILEAEIALSDIPESERPLVVEGAFLVWTMSYRWEGGELRRDSAIYIRRLPAWNAQEAEKAIHAARSLRTSIDWE